MEGPKLPNKVSPHSKDPHHRSWILRCASGLHFASLFWPLTYAFAAGNGALFHAAAALRRGGVRCTYVAGKLVAPPQSNLVSPSIEHARCTYRRGRGMAMAEGSAAPVKLVDVPYDFQDPITHELMWDPVLLVETGHSYNRPSIQQWFQRGNRTCPKTNRKLKSLLVAVRQP